MILVFLKLSKTIPFNIVQVMIEISSSEIEKVKMLRMCILHHVFSNVRSFSGTPGGFSPHSKVSFHEMYTVNSG